MGTNTWCNCYSKIVWLRRHYVCLVITCIESFWYAVVLYLNAATGCRRSMVWIRRAFRCKQVFTLYRTNTHIAVSLYALNLLWTCICVNTKQSKVEGILTIKFFFPIWFEYDNVLLAFDLLRALSVQDQQDLESLYCLVICNRQVPHL